MMRTMSVALLGVLLAASAAMADVKGDAIAMRHQALGSRFDAEQKRIAFDAASYNAQVSRIDAVNRGCAEDTLKPIDDLFEEGYQRADEAYASETEGGHVVFSLGMGWFAAGVAAEPDSEANMFFAYAEVYFQSANGYYFDAKIGYMEATDKLITSQEQYEQAQPPDEGEDEPDEEEPGDDDPI